LFESLTATFSFIFCEETIFSGEEKAMGTVHGELLIKVRWLSGTCLMFEVLW